MEVVKFTKDHLSQLSHERSVKALMPMLTEAHLKALENATYSYTGIHDGKVIFCAGIIEYWKGRGEAWAFLDSYSRKHFMAVHNSVKRFLKICPLKRIEAIVDYEFEEGHRWVKSLGFELEAEFLEAYRMDGGNASLYARVQ